MLPPCIWPWLSNAGSFQREVTSSLYNRTLKQHFLWGSKWRNVLSWKKWGLLSVICGPVWIFIVENEKVLCTTTEITCSKMEHMAPLDMKAKETQTLLLIGGIYWFPGSPLMGLTPSFYICRRKHLFESRVVRLFLRSTFVSCQPSAYER